jgi:hypothetical protein
VGKELDVPDMTGLQIHVEKSTTRFLFSQANIDLAAMRQVGGALEEIVNVREAGRRLGGISPWTINSWFSKGFLTRIKVGARTMVRVSDLERIITEGEGGVSPRGKRLNQDAAPAARPAPQAGPEPAANGNRARARRTAKKKRAAAAPADSSAPGADRSMPNIAHAPDLRIRQSRRDQRP